MFAPKSEIMTEIDKNIRSQLALGGLGREVGGNSSFDQRPNQTNRTSDTEPDLHPGQIDNLIRRVSHLPLGLQIFTFEIVGIGFCGLGAYGLRGLFSWRGFGWKTFGFALGILGWAGGCTVLGWFAFGDPRVFWGLT